MSLRTPTSTNQFNPLHEHVVYLASLTLAGSRRSRGALMGLHGISHLLSNGGIPAMQAGARIGAAGAGIGATGAGIGAAGAGIGVVGARIGAQGLESVLPGQTVLLYCLVCQA